MSRYNKYYVFEDGDLIGEIETDSNREDALEFARSEYDDFDDVTIEPV